MAQRRPEPERCGECGACVDATPNHPRNWPRRIVATSATIGEAIVAFHQNVDEYNADFAVPEFAAACNEKWGVPPVPTRG